MGQGGAGALAAWAKQLGRSVRGGWVNEYIRGGARARAAAEGARKAQGVPNNNL